MVTVDDYDYPETVLEKSQRLLRETEHVAADLERRQNPPQWEPPPAPPEPIPPVRRPARAPRDWESEAKYFAAAAGAATDQKIAALKREIVDGIGLVIAEERRNQAKALGELRAELDKEVAALRREITVTGDLKATLENHITRIDAMFTRMWATDALLDLKQRDMLGLPRH